MDLETEPELDLQASSCDANHTDCTVRLPHPVRIRFFRRDAGRREMAIDVSVRGTDPSPLAGSIFEIVQEKATGTKLMTSLLPGVASDL